MVDRILLTGATGFLGTHLIDVFSDYELRVLTRSPKKLSNHSLDVVVGDLTTDLSDTLFDDITVLIHSAAKVGSWPKDPMKGYYQTNVEGTENLITSAVDHEIDQIIYTSSYFALGDTGEEIADETWDNPPEFDHPYVNTKYQAGQIVDKVAETYPITQLLPTTIIGPGINNPISNVLIDYINGNLIGLPGGGSAGQNIVAVTDVARAHLLAVEKNKPGKYIIGNENMQLVELVNRIGERLDIKSPRSVPYWLASIYAWFQELRGTPDLTRGDIAVSRRNYRYDSSKSKILGYEPTSLDATIDAMLQDFLKRDLLNTTGEERVLRYLNL